MTRLIRARDDLFDKLVLRTLDGQGLHAAWGEPDADGIYEPTLYATDDGMTVVPRAHWDTMLSLLRNLARSGALWKSECRKLAEIDPAFAPEDDR